jgi:hypothetical protein
MEQEKPTNTVDQFTRGGENRPAEKNLKSILMEQCDEGVV